MNDNENNFEALRQLLALKRHEIPPPGYFDHFSAEVISRIRAGDGGETTGSWFSKLLQAFEFKPAFAGAFASALLLLLVFGIVYAGNPDGSLQTILQPQTDNGAPQLAVTSPATSTALTSMPTQTGMIASTNPVLSLQPVGSLFGQQTPFAQQVSFLAPGN
ncbi:MAG: hypothetical protein ACREFE_05690 [Limisphaerales bacterium]